MNSEKILDLHQVGLKINGRKFSKSTQLKPSFRKNSQVHEEREKIIQSFQEESKINTEVKIEEKKKNSQKGVIFKSKKLQEAVTNRSSKELT